MKVKFRSFRGQARTYLVVLTGLGTAGLVIPSLDGRSWTPVALHKGVKVPGPYPTRDKAAQALSAAMAQRLADRPGHRNRKVAV